MAERITPEALADLRRRWSKPLPGTIFLLDEIEASWAERDEARAEADRLQRQVEGHCEEIQRLRNLLASVKP